MEYQLPRLTKMWTHLERQAGGKVKGMGEKQIEVDKRILRTQVGIFYRIFILTFYYNNNSSSIYLSVGPLSGICKLQTIKSRPCCLF